MPLAKRIFLSAGIYGLLVVTPQYFLERRVGVDEPPAITHPEFFYGFVGVALAWQVAFLLIARDPTRYRLLMLPAIAEKLSFGIAAVILFGMQRCSVTVVSFGVIDLVWATLFFVAWRKCPDVAGP